MFDWLFSDDDEQTEREPTEDTSGGFDDGMTNVPEGEEYAEEGTLSTDWEEWSADDDTADDYSSGATDEQGVLYDDLFVASDDGSMQDYGGSAGGAFDVGPELSDPIVMGDTIGDPDDDAGIAKDRGRALGYSHGYAGKPFNDANEFVGPVRSAFKQGYAEGFALGTQDRVGGAPPAVTGVKKPAGYPTENGGGSSSVEESGDAPMSSGTKIGLALLGTAAAVVAVAAVNRKRRRAA